MATANVRGVKIHYEVFGKSGPWVALTTGGRRDFSEFAGLAERLAAEGFRVVLHDRRNTGASDIVIDGDEGEEAIWADDLYELLGQLGARPAFIGGASSGSRTSLLYYLRHPEAVRGLMLMQVTGGAFAAERLPENYYGQYIRAAREGGMAAVCRTEMYKERIAANPSNGPRLMAMKPERFIAVMQRWLDIFLSGPKEPLLGVSPDQLRSIKVPAIVIPGNDLTHAAVSGRAAQKLIPGAELFELPIQHQDVPVITYAELKEKHEPAIAAAFTGFMRRVESRKLSSPSRPQPA
ncbi:MAG TPA: alpha/beta hydrolase [Burkholderiales bacterium]